MEDYRERHRKEAARIQRRNRTILVSLVLLVVVIAAAILFIRKLTPSKERADIEAYYAIPQGEAMVLMENSKYEKNALIEGGEVYLDIDTVKEYFNSRFYWDAGENTVIYTTATEVIKATVGSADYYVNKSKNTLKAPVVKTKGDMAYLSLSFVKLYSNMDYQTYTNPDRVVIQYAYGQEFLKSVVKKSTALRAEGTIKAEILADLAPESKVTYLVDGSVDGKFAQVITEDGLVGFVKQSALQESQYESLTSDYVEPVYPSITSDQKLNLVWHQVTNQSANDNLLNLIADTKGVTTVCPTWFSVNSEKGGISSLASTNYVDRAHAGNLDVWGLVDDFDPDTSIATVLGATTSREKLENELIAAALKYNLDGLNIDFEHISEEAAESYIQFMRELSIKCRNNGIVLSADTYVPSVYTEYLDRKELGVVTDYVIIMAYDEHTKNSEEAGSVASLPFLQQAVTDSLELIPASKLVMGVPFYTRLWTSTEGEDGTMKVQESTVYSMKNTPALLKEEDLTPTWDETMGQNYAEYQKGDNFCQIWVEDAMSMEAKMKTIYAGNCGGVACWRLGLESNDVWDIILKYVN